MSSARSYHLQKHESAADGVRRIALGRADEALEKLRRAERGTIWRPPSTAPAKT